MAYEVITSLLGRLIKESIIKVDAPTDPDRINKDHPLIHHIAEELKKRYTLDGYSSNDLKKKLMIILETDNEKFKATVRELVYKYYKSKVIVKGPSDRFKEPGTRTHWTF